MMMIISATPRLCSAGLHPDQLEDAGGERRGAGRDAGDGRRGDQHRESVLTMIVTGAGEQVQPVGVRPVGVLGHGRHRQ